MGIKNDVGFKFQFRVVEKSARKSAKISQGFQTSVPNHDKKCIIYAI